MLKLSKKNESGRSMIEMLGVLAVIGVLSVGGVAGYTTAMNSHYANQAADQARRLAAIASAKRLLNPSAYLTDSETKGKYTFTMAPDEKDFIKLTVTGLPAAVASRVKGMNWEIANVADGETDGSLVFTFKNDLSKIGDSSNSGDSGNEEESSPCAGLEEGESCGTNKSCQSGSCVCDEGYQDNESGECVTSCSADNLSACDETACYALMDDWTSGPQYQWYNDRCIEHMTTCSGEYGYTQSECQEMSQSDAFYWSSSAGKCYFVEGECESLSCGREACEDKPADVGYEGSCRWDEENEVCVSAVAQCDFDHLDQCTQEECNNLSDTVWRGGVCTRYGSNDIVEDWDQEKCQEAQAEGPTYTFWSYAHEKCFDASYFENEYNCTLVDETNESVAYCCDNDYSYYNLALDDSVPSDVCCEHSSWPYYAQDSYGVAFCYEDHDYTETFSEGATLRACMAAHGDTEESRYSWLNTGWDQEDGGSYCCFDNALSSQTGEPDQECCNAVDGAEWRNGKCCVETMEGWMELNSVNSCE